MSIAPLVDFHCHLDLYPDHAAAVADCEREGVFTLTVTTTPKAWERNQQLASRTKYVRAALGLHPQLVAERADEIGLWESYLPQAKYIGEVGLDASQQYYSSFDAQKRIFGRVLDKCADIGGKILTVHSVRSSRVVLDMLEKHLPANRGTVVLHWFTGTEAEAKRAVDLGCYFSINSEMLSKAKNTSMVASLPLDRLLTETDGPFTKVAGRPSRPSDIAQTIARLAACRLMDETAVSVAIASNLKALLSKCPEPF